MLQDPENLDLLDLLYFLTKKLIKCIVNTILLQIRECSFIEQTLRNNFCLGGKLEKCNGQELEATEAHEITVFYKKKTGNIRVC